MDLVLMSASDAAAAIRNGTITSEELVQACLDHIAQLEDRVEAWAFLEPELALEQARKADLALQAGIAVGPLHGIPVGIKDIIDTKDMPTEDGTVLHAGRQPLEDATIIRRLREAGAIILGKTVTTELAVFAPSKTKNPHDLERTPGGSSSGSAAAVAAGMIPLAVGTQTNGSVIRPASFCGVYGYKPTFGLISRHLVLQQSRRLDQIGVFARSVEDTALIAESLIGFDVNDPDTRVKARPALVRIQSEKPPMVPQLAFVKTPVWSRADESTKGAFTELASHLGERVDEVELPSPFARAHELHKTIMEADIARSFEREYNEGSDQLSSVLKEIIERGNQTLAVDYNNAVLSADELYRNFDKIFEWHDAIITPAAIGEAPMGLETTGDPTFCTIWTLCGMPSITLPVLQGENNMPLGLQLVGARGDDARLLRTARWLVKEITETDV